MLPVGMSNASAVIKINAPMIHVGGVVSACCLVDCRSNAQLMLTNCSGHVQWEYALALQAPSVTCSTPSERQRMMRLMRTLRRVVLMGMLLVLVAGVLRQRLPCALAGLALAAFVLLSLW